MREMPPSTNLETSSATIAATMNTPVAPIAAPITASASSESEGAR